MTPNVIVPALSTGVVVAESNVTDGALSSSAIVTVCAVTPPAVAFVSEPVLIVTTTVSSSSSSVSAVTAMLIVPLEDPAAIVRLPSARSWSVPDPVAVPETV